MIVDAILYCLYYFRVSFGKKGLISTTTVIAQHAVEAYNANLGNQFNFGLFMIAK